MGRSQRHMLVEQGSTAAGEIHAEGAVAPGIAMQVDPEQLNVMEAGPASPPYVAVFSDKPHPDPHSTVDVPIGEPGGPLTGSSLTGAIPESIDTGPAPEPGPEPEPGFEPTLTSIDPTSAIMGSADLTLTVTGTNFTDTSVINFNGGDEPTTFVSDTELTTGVKPSTAGVAGSYPVVVKQGRYTTSPQTFSFTDPEAPIDQARSTNDPAEQRDFPIGPIGITKVEKVGESLKIDLTGTDVQAGDFILVEATGNTEINGEYRVDSTEGSSIMVRSPDIELLQAITGRGRVTITAGGE